MQMINYVSLLLCNQPKTVLLGCGDSIHQPLFIYYQTASFTNTALRQCIVMHHCIRAILRQCIVMHHCIRAILRQCIVVHHCILRAILRQCIVMHHCILRAILQQCIVVHHCILGYLDTWSGFEAAKTAPWPNRDSTIVVNSLSPQMSELVKDAIAS